MDFQYLDLETQKVRAEPPFSAKAICDNMNTQELEYAESYMRRTAGKTKDRSATLGQKWPQK